MSWRPAPVPIAGELRKRVNRIAHAAALRHELDTRTRLLADLQRLAESGSRMPDLNAHLSKVEAEISGGSA